MYKVYKAQSLIEILIALAIGTAFINVGILAMSTANILARVNKANNFALSLLKSQRSIIETITENGWHSIDDLTIGKHYKLAKQNNSWVIQPGEEKVFDEKPPVAQWNFDEGSGITAYDNMGTNNGTLSSTQSWQGWQFPFSCVSGYCLDFAGWNGYIEVPDANDLDITNAITIEAWVNTQTNDANEHYILKKSSAGQKSYELYQSGTQLKFSISNNGSTLQTVNTDDGFFPYGEWVHTVVTYDGTSWKAYKNGQSFQTYGTVSGSIYPGTSSLIIRPGVPDVFLMDSYYIDDVRIYDYALNENQIKQHYNAGLNRLGLVAQWGMDEGSGIKVYDSQGANEGTRTSTSTWTTGKVGGALTLNGTSDYVNMPYDFSLASEISMCAWVFPESYQSNNGGPDYSARVIVDTNNISDYRSNDESHGLLIYGSSNGVWQAAINWDGEVSPVNRAAVNGNVAPLNTWTFVCMAANGVDLRIYENGNYVNKTTYTNIGLYSPANLNIGKFSATGLGGYFDGSIDDIRIYNRALSADEIANQYKDGYTKYFYVNNVSRNILDGDPTSSNHNLEETYDSAHNDPNTKKVVNVARYLLGAPGRVNTQEQYLARAANINSLVQTDWSGSSGIEGPEMKWSKNYWNAENILTIVPNQISLSSISSEGNLTSSVVDTQSIGGSGYFNILWQGYSLCSGCEVKFKIAASNCINGASNYPTCNTGNWTYYGPTSTSDYYIPGRGTLVPITYAGEYSTNAASVQNKRYIRYLITLVPAINTSPIVTSVIINYSP